MACCLLHPGYLRGHLDQYYSNIITTPAIYWKLSIEWFPTDHEIVLDDSKGDKCHYNLLNVHNNEGEKIFKTFTKGNIFICKEGNSPNITMEQINEAIQSGEIKLQTSVI